ncbi:NAD(P)-binding domain-containing protein [Psychrobium sp. nBUS_13]|uniref:NAD(P)-binding domain-containing protein n=1 Tax=Psychrobium sp. nBUS_13 TaxID=3395319 RepID=UPI003EB93289
MNNTFHTIIIGGGQAGLSAGYYLQQRQLKYLILEREDAVGEQWRKRFDGLTLFTPNAMNTLPGFDAPISNGNYQTKDEFADYLSQYSQQCKLPIKLSTYVIEICRLPSGDYEITTNNETYISTHIIMATGAFKDIAIPNIAHRNTGKQQTINQLSNTNLYDKHILVVGDGASGRQVAKQLSTTNNVSLAQGKQRHLVKESVAGFNTFTLLRFFGLLRLPKDWPIAKWLKQRDPFPDTQIVTTQHFKASVLN